MIATITTAKEAERAILEVLRQCPEDSDARAVAEAAWQRARKELALINSARRGHRYVAIRSSAVCFFHTFADAVAFAKENPEWTAQCLAH